MKRRVKVSEFLHEALISQTNLSVKVQSAGTRDEVAVDVQVVPTRHEKHKQVKPQKPKSSSPAPSSPQLITYTLNSCWPRPKLYLILYIHQPDIVLCHCGYFFDLRVTYGANDLDLVHAFHDRRYVLLLQLQVPFIFFNNRHF